MDSSPDGPCAFFSFNARAGLWLAGARRDLDGYRVELFEQDPSAE
jgi:hypothetical protein